jgi:hypothetical protein
MGSAAGFRLSPDVAALLTDAEMSDAEAGRLLRSLICCDPMGLPEKFSLVWRRAMGHPDRISARAAMRRRELEREAARGVARKARARR